MAEEIPNQDVLADIVECLTNEAIVDRDDLEALLVCLTAHAKHNLESAEAMGLEKTLTLSMYLKIDAKTGEIAESIQFSPTSG